MGCTTIEEGRVMVRAREIGMTMTRTARIFKTSRQTVSKWINRARKEGRRNGLRKKSTRPHRIRTKVTVLVETAIVLLRDAFNWGTQRIRVILKSPPEYIRYLLWNALGVIWKPMELSRQRINEVLVKHGINGSPYNAARDWKYFQASKPNELWQIDMRGTFKLHYQRRNVLVIVDDYSRFLIACQYLEGLKTEDVLLILRRAVERYGPPEKVLVDNGSQFLDIFEKACKELGIEVEHTPPNYHRSKGKVERAIRNFNEEYLRLQRVFDSVEDLLSEFVMSYNYERYHMGIDGIPAERYSAGCKQCRLTIQLQKY